VELGCENATVGKNGLIRPLSSSAAFGRFVREEMRPVACLPSSGEGVVCQGMGKIPKYVSLKES